VTFSAGRVIDGSRSEALPARERAPLVDGWGLLTLPGVGFLALAFFIPLAGMMVRSVSDPSPANYLAVAETPVFLRSMLYTFEVALLVTLSCLVLGYPWAYLMNQAGGRWRWALAALVVLPLWSSLLVRTYAWTVLLRDSGVVNQLLQRVHLIGQPLPLMGNTLGVAIGMTQLMLPFMVLPIFAVLRQIDVDLLPAAESLGARPLAAFVRVLWPLTLPGVFAGCLLVFVVSLGFFITPALLGSGRSPMLSQLIVEQTNVLFHFGVGSALAVVLLIVTFALIWVGTRFVPWTQALGYGESDRT
jgi:putative spermidine/putrescine transport system permease protein